MKFRKLPVEIDAVQWREGLTAVESMDITDLIVREWGYPWLLGNALEPETLRAPDGSVQNGIWIAPADGALMIRTLEGDMKVSPGDWIIRGVAGEVYPCRPDIFAATYAPAESGTAERAAVGLVGALLADCLSVVKDPERSPDARLFALVLGRNIMHWDAGTGTVEIGSAERKLLENPLNIVK